MSEVHICAPGPALVWLGRNECPTCGVSRRFVCERYEWYGGVDTCLRCGDSWDEDGRRERPFRRNWRPRAVVAAWGRYARFTKQQKGGE